MSAPIEGNYSALATAWSAYRRSAASARSESSTLRSWRWRVLAITLAGAVTSAAADALRQAADSGVLPGWLVTVSGAAGAALLALAAFLTASLLTTARQRRWTVNRAVAEALKSECFRYATNVAPYDDGTASTRLLDRLEHLTSALDGVQLPLATAAPGKGLQAPLSMDDYLQQRVNNQISWYRGRAFAAHNRLRRFRYASVTLGVFAAVLPVIGTIMDATGPASWAGVATTAGTAIASFIYAERFSFLEQSYTATANRLELLAARWQVSPQAEADGQHLVDSVENALATENTGWMAELLRQPND